MNNVYDPLKGEGIERTDVYCTECGRNFIGQIDFSIDGNHIIICPYCGHEHCRVVENGRITEARWSSRNSKASENIGIWAHHNLKIETNTAAQFLRNKWLNLGK